MSEIPPDGQAQVDDVEIPDWDESGVLPDGIHRATKEAIEDRFTFNDHRRRLFSDLKQWWDDANENGVAPIRQWTNGSFAESKPEPNDVDVASFMDHDILDNLTVRAQNFLRRWMSCGRAQDKYRVDCSFFPCCPPDHKFYPAWKKKRDYYRKLYGYTRTAAPKGFLQIDHGDLSASIDDAFRDANG